MSHTPGPWKVVASGQIGRASAEFYIWSSYGDQRSPSVAHIKHSTKQPTLANARLIASAPDLLAALEAMLDECYDTERNDAIRLAVRKARAAIAKAKGEA